MNSQGNDREFSEDGEFTESNEEGSDVFSELPQLQEHASSSTGWNQLFKIQSMSGLEDQTNSDIDTHKESVIGTDVLQPSESALELVSEEAKDSQERQPTSPIEAISDPITQLEDLQAKEPNWPTVSQTPERVDTVNDGSIAVSLQASISDLKAVTSSSIAVPPIVTQSLDSEELTNKLLDMKNRKNPRGTGKNLLAMIRIQKKEKEDKNLPVVT